MAYDDHSGTNKFARTLADRINAQIPSGLIMDFAQVNSDMSLTTNTFPQKIPKDDYTVCRNFTGYTLTTTTNGYHPHNHNVSLPKIKPGRKEGVLNGRCAISGHGVPRICLRGRRI